MFPAKLLWLACVKVIGMIFLDRSVALEEILHPKTLSASTILVLVFLHHISPAISNAGNFFSGSGHALEYRCDIVLSPTSHADNYNIKFYFSMNVLSPDYYQMVKSKDVVRLQVLLSP